MRARDVETCDPVTRDPKTSGLNEARVREAHSPLHGGQPVGGQGHIRENVSFSLGFPWDLF